MTKSIQQKPSKEPGTSTALVKAEDAARAKAEHDAHMARCALRPDLNAAAVVDPYATKVFGNLNWIALANELKAASEALRTNDLSRCEDMLFAQANALQALFTRLARQAADQSGLSQIEGLMRLALKAQSQSRATLEALAAMKNPAAPTFVKQTNIAQGPQQVNNHAGSQSEALGSHQTRTPVRAPARKKTEIAQNKVMEITHEQGQRLDPGTTQGASGAHPPMETVDAKHRPQDGKRKSGIKP